MIKPTTKNSSKVINAIIEMGFRPWKYPSEIAWQRVADTYNHLNPDDELSPEAIRSRYRRIMSWLDDNDYTPEEYAAQVQRVVGHNHIPWDNEDFEAYNNSDEDHEEVRVNLKVQSPEELIKAAGLDPRFYEPSTGKVSHWSNGGGTNWSISAKFKRRQIPDDEVLDYIVEVANRVDPLPYRLEAPESIEGDDLLCVLSLYDVHLEKIELDSTIESKIRDYHVSILNLLGRLPEVSQFVLPFGNDFGNFDNVQGETTKGTPQDNAVTWREAIDLRVKLMLWTVELLSEIAPVHVIFVPGNHDRLTTYFLGKVLETRYEEDIYITSDNSHGTRKYYLWNNIGLMFTHGSDEKISKLPMLFATEGNHAFGPATHREIHTGDKHTKEVWEEFGVILRRLPSLSGPDEWHSDHGFVGNGKCAVALTYTKDRLDSELLCYVR